MGKSWIPPHTRQPGTSGDAAAPLARRIADHIPLVRRLAWQLHRRAPGVTDPEELIQSGMVALVEAASQWEDRGYAFATYAQMRVRGAMIDCLRRDATLSRTAIARKREVERIRIQLMGELLRMPSAAEMAAALGLDAAGWRQLEQAVEPIAFEPLDLFGEGEGPALHDPAEAAEAALIRAEGAELLARAIAALPERQGLVLQLYFVEQLSLDDIGAVLGVGAARVCQIKKTALDRLRQAMLADGQPGDGDDDGR